MIDKLMEYFEGYTLDIVIKTLFEMNKYFDKNLKVYYKEVQKENGITLDSFERKMLRNYYYYQNDEILNEIGIKDFPVMQYDMEDVKYIVNSTLEKINTLDSQKIINSIKSRISEIDKVKEEKEKSKKWLNKYSDYTVSSIITLNINQRMIDKFGYNYESGIFNIINKMYESLRNYRHVAIIIKEELYYNSKNITWDVLSDVAIYMENFREYNEKYTAFKKEKKIEEMKNFLNSNEYIDNTKIEKISNDFYSSISYGFSFCDLLISDDEKTKILIMRKVELDESPVLCPSCMSTMSRSNSYPLMFLKSYECQNPNCPERSKSGRGKRYDEYGTFRYYKLVENNKSNIISNEMYKNWHRDIFASNLDIYDMLISYYTWNNEKVMIINDRYNNLERHKTRKIEYKEIEEFDISNNIKLEDLKIYKYFLNVYNSYNYSVKKEKCKNDKLLIYNENSTYGIPKYDINISSAITSPPYYNAREYSNWSNFVLYLTDMMFNAKSIYDNTDDKFVYLYNVGDIVDFDNVYVSSNMSNRRIMLGFYSALIFKIVGFKLSGNIIWDKGEVESKRNSSVNLFSGYLKYVNCYEHVLIFKKELSSINESKVCKIKPVYKINNKGENILGHTAPYPEEIAQLVIPYIENKDGYVLDPYLGSGTTGLCCKKNNLKFIGFELDKEYFKLAKKRVENENNNRVIQLNFEDLMINEEKRLG